VQGLSEVRVTCPEDVHQLLQKAIFFFCVLSFVFRLSSFAFRLSSFVFRLSSFVVCLCLSSFFFSFFFCVLSFSSFVFCLLSFVFFVFFFFFLLCFVFFVFCLFCLLSFVFCLCLLSFVFRCTHCLPIHSTVQIIRCTHSSVVLTELCTSTVRP
jgi:hypothetical protein